MCGRSGALDDHREVGDIFADATLGGQTFAPAMAAAVVDDDAEALGEAGHNERPLHVVDPGPVDEHKRVARAELLEEDTDAVDGLGGHMGTSEGRV